MKDFDNRIMAESMVKWLCQKQSKNNADTDDISADAKTAEDMINKSFGE